MESFEDVSWVLIGRPDTFLSRTVQTEIRADTCGLPAQDI